MLQRKKTCMMCELTIFLLWLLFVCFTCTYSFSQLFPARSRTPDMKRHMIVIPDSKSRARSVTPEPPERRMLVPPEVHKKAKSLTPDAVPPPVGKKRWRLGSRESKEATSVSSNSKKTRKVNRTASSKPWLSTASLCSLRTYFLHLVPNLAIFCYM